MNNVDIRLLKEIADLEGTPKGAYNIRKNGQLDSRKTTANIDIVTKEDKPGIDIHIKPGTKHQSVHIPVLLTETGLDDLVYNDEQEENASGEKKPHGPSAWSCCPSP